MTREILIELADRAFSKSPWHSLMAALDGVSETAFHWQPESHNGFPWINGSIEDIVYHVSGDKLVQLNHAFGDGTMNWKNVPIEKGADSIQQLQSSQAELISAQNNTSDFAAKVSSWGGKRMSANHLFLMLIEHDIYHAGQIRYIRNLVE